MFDPQTHRTAPRKGDSAQTTLTNPLSFPPKKALGGARKCRSTLTLIRVAISRRLRLETRGDAGEHAPRRVVTMDAIKDEKLILMN